MNRSKRTAGRFFIARLSRSLRLRLVLPRNSPRCVVINRLLFDLRLHFKRFPVTYDFKFDLFIQLGLGHESPQRAEILHLVPIEFADNIARLNARLSCGRPCHYFRNRHALGVRAVFTGLQSSRLDAKVPANDPALFQ